MHFAHSIEGQDTANSQGLPCHLRNVSNLAASSAEKFGAARLAHLIGLLHDLGKYTKDFQDYIAGKGASPDHATAGAREILRLAPPAGPDRFAALIGAYCIAGHHGGLPDWGGERPLSERLKKELPLLDPVWQRDLALEASGLFPKSFKRHQDPSLAAFQLAMFGRMVFSCLVDADYRDTEKFYATAKGGSVDRDWPTLASLVDGLLARFDLYLADIQARPGGNPTLNRLRADILSYARGKATLPRGVFTLDVPTGGGKTLASLGFALAHAKTHGMDRIVYGIPFTSIIDQTAGIFRDVCWLRHASRAVSFSRRSASLRWTLTRSLRRSCA